MVEPAGRRRDARHARVDDPLAQLAGDNDTLSGVCCDERRDVERVVLETGVETLQAASLKRFGPPSEWGKLTTVAVCTALRPAFLAR